MTPEEQAKENAKIQKQMYQESEKLNCRKMALQISQSFAAPDAEQMLKQTNKIYEWLIQDIK